MDIQLKKKPWYIRHIYKLLTCALFITLLVYAIILQFGPRRLNVKIDDSFVKTAQVKSDKFKN